METGVRPRRRAGAIADRTGAVEHMKHLDYGYRTLYAELSQRVLDAAFSWDFAVEGRFVTQESGGRRY